MMMLFTNKKIDVVNIPLKQMEKIHNESSPLFEENNVKETKQVCENLLKEAHQQKENLLKETLEEIEQIKKAAYDEAYEQGYRKGHEQGHSIGQQESLELTNQYIKELKDHCQRIQVESDRYMDEVVDDLLQLTKKVVEKLTFQVIQDSENTILPIIQNQLKEISRRKQIFIRLNSDCYDNVKSQVSQLQQYCTQAQLHLVPDMTLTSYGCVIETESEIIDLQLDKQLTNLFIEFERVVFES